MSFTQADIDALEEAIAEGVQKVRYESNGEIYEVVYQSRRDMLATLAMMRGSVIGRKESFRANRVAGSYNPNF